MFLYFAGDVFEIISENLWGDFIIKISGRKYLNPNSTYYSLPLAPEAIEPPSKMVSCSYVRGGVELSGEFDSGGGEWRGEFDRGGGEWRGDFDSLGE